MSFYYNGQKVSARSHVDTKATLEELTVTQNGVYTPTMNKAGFSKVIVDVPKDITIPPFTGDCSKLFYGDRWRWILEDYGQFVSTTNITNCSEMFRDCYDIENIPFEINCKSTSNLDLSSMFSYCTSLRSVPKINTCKVSSTSNLFTNTNMLRCLPEDIESWFDWSYIDNLTSTYLGNRSSQFQWCRSLRSIPVGFLNHGNPAPTYSASIYYNAFHDCSTLDEILNLPNPHLSATWTSNAFYSAFENCRRLKNLSFATPDGQPYVVSWKAQIIDLSKYVGYGQGSMPNYITDHNSGLTTETQIKDDATYQLYKNHPDSWTFDMAYSRYNHDSAVATINSLPDTSAYLAENGGTNTIKFKGASGSKTDGGAINTLTEEEIAVATAKGWTVTFV